MSDEYKELQDEHIILLSKYKSILFDNTTYHHSQKLNAIESLKMKMKYVTENQIKIQINYN